MKKGIKKLIALSSCVAMLGCSMGALAACKPKEQEEEIKDGYNTTTSVMPSNWNVLTYEDANDTQIMDYIASAFYEFDFEFDEEKGGKFKDGKVNADAIVENSFVMQYSAATALKDVTSTYAAQFGITDPEGDTPTADYCWEITLRNDLKWDDGTPITAADFEYSMKEQLNPDFQNYRGNTFYDTSPIAGARNYFFQGSSGWFPGTGPYTVADYSSDLDSTLVFTLGNASENEAFGGTKSWLRSYVESAGGSATWTAAQVVSVLPQLGLSGVPEAEVWAALEGKTFAEIKADADLNAKYNTIKDFWCNSTEGEMLQLAIANYEYPEYDWKDVGFFKVQDSDYKFVICFTTSQPCLKEDGSLSYNAGYALQSLPLVKQSLYESCKKAPADGATLWTSNYCTSLETTASWGPYKLTSFQGGKAYTLEKNPYWYGYNLDQYNDQFLIDKINCEQISDTNTLWMKFLSGKTDAVGVDIGHKDDYINSKYALSTPGTGCYSLNLYGGLEELKESGRNSGILAITDFRKAVSLAIDRVDYNSKTTTAAKPLYGYLNGMYYYDVENGLTYRDTDQAKTALLTAYGYKHEDDGTWTLESNDAIDHLSLEAAYATLRGYDLVQAKELVESAYTELTTNAEYYGYDANTKITLKYGTSTDNANVRRDYDYIVALFDKLLEGTSLENKIEITFDASFGSKWADEFKAGNYEIASGTGWQGAAFNPCYMISAYLDPESAYTSYWDTKTENMTFTMPGDDASKGLGVELTMPIMDWWLCLNGDEKATYNWSDGAIPVESRLELLAKLETVALSKYYSIPTTSQNSVSLLGMKYTNITDTYNTFMGFGGMQYRRINYSFDEWKNVISSHNNDLSSEYKKSE